MQRDYQRNGLVQFLYGLTEQEYFTDVELAQAVDAYRVATTVSGETLFPMLGFEFNDTPRVRTGQIIQYDATTGKRNKNKIPPVDWLHRRFGIDNDATRKCFFGEHLLALYPEKDVAIVEAPKTAIIASIYYGDAFVWLATCGKSGTKTSQREVCKPLVGRTVVLFPDLNAWDEWNLRAANMRTNGVADVRLDDFIFHKTSKEEKQQGLDIADYLLKHKKQDLRK
jgi:hypothetical protein